MTERPRRKWAEIQVDLFMDAARRQAGDGARDRFEDLFHKLVPPTSPRNPPRSGRQTIPDGRADEPNSDESER